MTPQPNKPWKECIVEKHVLYGACYVCCETCNIDRHLCGGCGANIDHLQGSCDKCALEHGPGDLANFKVPTGKLTVISALPGGPTLTYPLSRVVEWASSDGFFEVTTWGERFMDPTPTEMMPFATTLRVTLMPNTMDYELWYDAVGKDILPESSYHIEHQLNSEGSRVDELEQILQLKDQLARPAEPISDQVLRESMDRHGE